MIDIIGNIKLNNNTRIKYFLYSIASLTFLRNEASFYINIDNDFSEFQKKDLLDRVIKLIPDVNISFKRNIDHNYATNYLELLNKSNNDYVFHFEEDHFCVLDDIILFENMLKDCKNNNVDIVRLTYFDIVQKLTKDISFDLETQHVKILKNDVKAYSKSCKTEIGHSYYIGTNNIFKKNFAFKFWNRNIKSFSPHSYEIDHYEDNFLHFLGVPKFEILRCIDDDHGIKNSSIINGNVSEKYNNIKKIID